MSLPSTIVIFRCIVVGSRVLALVVLSEMMRSTLMLFGVISEPVVLLPLSVMKLLESYF
jgi:hypothetical protein